MMDDDGKPPVIHHFSYARALAPMMWVLVCIASVELVVTHVLIALWWPQLGIALSVMTFAIIAFLVRQILFFDALPVALGEGVLLMRVGRLKSVSVPLDQIASASGDIPDGVARDSSVFNLALIAYPNVIVRLAEPVAVGPAWKRRPVSAIAHRLDDPAGFLSFFGEE